MGTVQKQEVKAAIENLSSGLSSAEAQNIFYNIVFKKKVEEGLKEADAGETTDWEDFKKEMEEWPKSK